MSRRLKQEDVELITVKRGELDLRDQAAVNQWFADRRPQVVFLAAAKVGGIVANNTLRACVHRTLADLKKTRMRIA